MRLIRRFVIIKRHNSITTHHLSVRRKPSRREARALVQAQAHVRACSAHAARDCTHVAHRAPWPSGVIHSQRPCRRSPSTFIMCARSRTHAFNYIFASQQPRERETGRGYAMGTGRPLEEEKRHTRTIHLRNCCTDVTKNPAEAGRARAAIAL